MVASVYRIFWLQFCTVGGSRNVTSICLPQLQWHKRVVKSWEHAAFDVVILFLDDWFGKAVQPLRCSTGCPPKTVMWRGAGFHWHFIKDITYSTDDLQSHILFTQTSTCPCNLYWRSYVLFLTDSNCIEIHSLNLIMKQGLQGNLSTLNINAVRHADRLRPLLATLKSLLNYKEELFLI